MAVGDLIGAAVGVILLVIVAYLLVGSVISTALVVSNAQKSATLLEENQLKTDFTIVQTGLEQDSQYSTIDINCTITNTGNEVISDFTHMDIIVYDTGTNDFQLYTYSSALGAPGPGRSLTRVLMLSIHQNWIPGTRIGSLYGQRAHLPPGSRSPREMGYTRRHLSREERKYGS